MAKRWLGVVGAKGIDTDRVSTLVWLNEGLPPR